MRCVRLSSELRLGILTIESPCFLIIYIFNYTVMNLIVLKENREQYEPSD